MQVYLLAALLVQAPAATPVRPSVTIPRLEATIAVDGKLDEAVWRQAARLADFRQYEPIDGQPAQEKTEVLVWYAPDAIHFGIIAHDREPGALRATQADRDNIEGEDHVLVFLDTFLDSRRAFFFGVNALGVQADGVRTEGASSAGRMFGGNTDYSPDYIFQSKGERTATGYTVEMRVPFKSLRYPSSEVQRWGLQIQRKTQRTGYTDTWTDVRRASASYLGQSGTIEGLRELVRGLVAEAQPFLTTVANGSRNLSTGEFTRADPAPEVGANLKLSSTNLALDATLNPDFSQVESDAGQVTVNERFALFFPEKRPFFLEGIELFNTPNQLVYTRQVVDPIAGGKVSGKVGSLGFAHLTAVDQDAEPVFDSFGTRTHARNALFNITRVRRDFGTNSLAGLLVSDRSVLAGHEYNRVVAGDVRYVFGRMYFAEVQVGNAWTRAANGSESGAIWRVTADRTGRQWGFNYSLNGVDETFVTHSGFVPRSGTVNGRISNRITIYGKPGGLLETVTTFFGPTRYWNYDDFGSGAAMEGEESANTTFRLRGGWSLDARIARNFQHFHDEDYAYTVQTTQGVQRYLPLAEVSGPSASFKMNTPVFRRFDANLSIARNSAPLFAEGSEGIAWTAAGGIALRPTASLRLGWTGSAQRLDRVRTGAEFARTLLTRLKAEYQPRRSLFFRVVGDVRDERVAPLEDARTGAPLLDQGQPVPQQHARSLRLDLLASYEPSPGTVAFLGYGASLLDHPLATTDWQRQTDGFFIKLAYALRF